MINPTMKVSATKLKRFNRMLLLQVQELLEEHHKLNCTKNLTLNHFMFCKIKTRKMPEFLYYFPMIVELITLVT